MTIRNFDRLLTPKSVALIGASPQPGSIGRIVKANLLAGGFKGTISLVNPKYRDIDGYPCQPSVGALPFAPDLAVIATPPTTVPGLIGELVVKGTRAAVVITAGIRGELHQSMLDAACPTCFRIQGPNCLGLMVPGIGLNASFSHRAPLAGNLAFLSQSGALITAVIDWAAARNIGFSHAVSLGDMADADFGDLLDYLAGDVRSRAILLYMESLTHAAKFMSAARRAARVKPVIVIKSGRHAAGAKAALSHTGALAGSDAAYDAAFRRAGLLRVHELENLFEAAEMIARVPRLEGERLIILTNGGGAGVLAADRLADLDGRMAEPSPELLRALDAVLPPTWSRGNPLDIIGDAGPDRYAAALGPMLQDGNADAILVLNCPTALSASDALAEGVVEVIRAKRAAGGRNKPVLTSWMGNGAAEPARRRLIEAGLATFETPTAAVDGFMQLVRHARAQEELMCAPPALPEGITPEVERARAVIAAATLARRPILSEVEAKALLAAYGIPVVPTAIVADPQSAGREAERLLAANEACVLKILSEDISHKSDVGGVRLQLESAAEVESAAREMLDKIRRAKPEARIEGFTVQPMVRKPRAHELIIGMAEDETFGPILMFGAGGTAVEIVKDTAQALPPLDLKLARDLMRQTRIHRLLEGYRDRPPAELEAIAMVLVRVSLLVVDNPEIRELDINPLLADDAGVVALDARVRIEAPGAAPRRPLSIRPYPQKWENTLMLAGLDEILVRPIRPEDEALYADFLAHVTQEDQRLRLFAPVRELSHNFIARLTQIDYAREMAFVAISKRAGNLLGVVRLTADPDYVRAEYAIIVRSDLKGHGLGWQLMKHLIAYARAEGLSQLFGSVLSENTTMLQMCRELGFRIRPDSADSGLRHVSLNVRDASLSLAVKCTARSE